MVVKINKGNSPFGAFSYNQTKVEKGEATVLKSSGFLHDENYHHSVKDCIRSLEPWLVANKRTEKPIVHISINPDPRDVVSDKTAIQIAQEYLSAMGYGKQPYILYKHEDIERTHYHVVTTCVDEKGNKINSDYEKRRSMKTCREIEKKYHLHIPNKKELREIDLPKKINYEKGDLRNQIVNTATKLSRYHIRSMAEYKTLLEYYNVTCKEIDGKIDDKEVHGLIYSATDESGQKVGQQLKSSLLGKNLGITFLKREIAKNMKVKLPVKDREFITRIIGQCMYLCKDRTREELVSLLQKRGVDLILRQTKDGSRLYGVTIIDHNTQRILKGSEVNPAFTANSLTQFFENPDYVIPLNKELAEVTSNDFPTKESESPMKMLEEGLFAHFGLPVALAYDADEEAYKRLQRKKKKKKV